MNTATARQSASKKSFLAFTLAAALLVLATVTMARGHANPAAGPAYDLASTGLPEETFAIDWWTIDGGGAFLTGGEDLALHATIGQVDANSRLQGGDLAMSTGFWTHVPWVYYTYLPMALCRMSDAPDLVVESIIAHPEAVTITIRNQGLTAVTPIFWIDLYVNPDPPPTRVNQIWPHLCSEGLVWSVRVPALPIAPGESRVFTVGDPYFTPEYSYVDWPLEVGTPIYVQVDSADAFTDYGAVRESHEIVGGPYNNILGPVWVTSGGIQAMPKPIEHPASPGVPPPRP